MKLSGNSRAGLLLVATLSAVWAAACSDDDGPNGINELGGSTYGGGSSTKAAGGSTNVGGASVQGGTIGTGGTTVANSAGSGATPTAGGSTAVTTGGSTSVGGASSAGAPTAGAGGGTAACGTTNGSFPLDSVTFAAGSTLPLDGFAKATTNSNANPVVDIVNTPTICAEGCLRVSGTFAPGDPLYNKTVAVQKSLTGAAANLLGAKVVVKMAVEGLASGIPIWLTLFSQGPGTNGAWGAVGKGNADLAAYNGTFAEFVWNVADMKDFEQKQFCAASVTNIGVMLQTGGTAPTAAGTVNVYIRSIEIRPAGYVPQGTGGSSGIAGSAGASSTLTAGNAGTAGTNQ